MQFVVDFRTYLSVHLGEGGQSRNLGDFIDVTVTAYVFLNPEIYDQQFLFIYDGSDLKS